MWRVFWATSTLVWTFSGLVLRLRVQPLLRQEKGVKRGKSETPKDPGFCSEN